MYSSAERRLGLPSGFLPQCGRKRGKNTFVLLSSFGLHLTAALKKQRAGPVQAIYVIFSSVKAKCLQKGFFFFI